MRHIRQITSLSLFWILFLPVMLPAESGNRDVLRMWRLGLDEETIVSAIRSARNGFDVGSEAMHRLSGYGLPVSLLRAMEDRQTELETNLLPRRRGMYQKSESGYRSLAGARVAHMSGLRKVRVLYTDLQPIRLDADNNRSLLWVGGAESSPLLVKMEAVENGRYQIFLAGHVPLGQIPMTISALQGEVFRLSLPDSLESGYYAMVSADTYEAVGLYIP